MVTTLVESIKTVYYERAKGKIMSSHAELLKRHRRVLPDWMNLYYDEPIEITHGEGRFVWDREGNRYLDFFGGILATSTAHALPEVVDAVQRQAGRLLHSSTLYLGEHQIELAEKIVALSGIPDAKVFFTPSGSEANEMALLMATSSRRSNQILALRNSYHGHSFGTIAVTGNRGWRASQLSPFNVSWVHGGYQYRSPWPDASSEEYIAHCVDDLQSVIQTSTGGDVAAMIFEPIQGVGGFSAPPDGLLAAFKDVLDAHHILMISDEVQTGWGRTGEHFWGFQAHAITPDLMTFAKGIGNGLSVGGVVGRRDLIDGVSAGQISTFGGTALTMAGSLANLNYILDHNLQENARLVGSRIIDGLQTEVAKGSLPIIGDIRGKGLMFAIELVKPNTRTPDPKSASAMLEASKERGLLIGKGGLNGNVLRMAPPMTITMDEAESGLELLLASLHAVQKQQTTDSADASVISTY